MELVLPRVPAPKQRVNARKPKSLRIRPGENIFVNEYLINGGNASAAYRKAFPAKVTNLSTRARKLLATARIQKHIDTRVAEMDKAAQYKRESAMAELAEAIDLAREIRNPSAMIQATKLKSQLAGLLIERHEVNMTRFDGLDLEEREAALQAVQAALAKAKLTAALS